MTLLVMFTLVSRMRVSYIPTFDHDETSLTGRMRSSKENDHKMRRKKA